MLFLPEGYLDLHEHNQPAPSYDGNYSTTLFTSKAIDMARGHVKTYGTDTPLFQYLAYQAIHSPLEVPTEYLVNYTSIANKDRRTACGMVTCLDFEVQRLVDAYKQMEIWNK